MDIDPRLKATAQAVIQKLMDDVRGLKAVVISTEDGFEIAARVENTAQISRLAAMASGRTRHGRPLRAALQQLLQQARPRAAARRHHTLYQLRQACRSRGQQGFGDDL